MNCRYCLECLAVEMLENDSFWHILTFSVFFDHNNKCSQSKTSRHWHFAGIINKFKGTHGQAVLSCCEGGDDASLGLC